MCLTCVQSPRQTQYESCRTCGPRRCSIIVDHSCKVVVVAPHSVSQIWSPSGRAWSSSAPTPGSQGQNWPEQRPGPDCPPCEGPGRIPEAAPPNSCASGLWRQTTTAPRSAPAARAPMRAAAGQAKRKAKRARAARAPEGARESAQAKARKRKPASRHHAHARANTHHQTARAQHNKAMRKVPLWRAGTEVHKQADNGPNLVDIGRVEVGPILGKIRPQLVEVGWRLADPGPPWDRSRPRNRPPPPPGRRRSWVS